MALTAAQQQLNNSLDLNGTATAPFASKALLHELQLGEQLNKSVHQARRADFSLMLAMLCDDVREQSQFALPQKEIKDSNINADLLRQQFQLPKKAPLALEALEQIKEYNQAQNISEPNLVNIHLNNSLNPKPLAFRDNVKHVVSTVMDNTTLVCQAKHAKSKENTVLNKRQAMNVEAWLQNIQLSLVKSRLVSGIVA